MHFFPWSESTQVVVSETMIGFFSYIDPRCNLQTRILAISNPKNSGFTAIPPFWKFKSWNKLNLLIQFSEIYEWPKFGVISLSQFKVITIWILICKIPGLYFTQIWNSHISATNCPMDLKFGLWCFFNEPHNICQNHKNLKTPMIPPKVHVICNTS